MKNNFPVNQLDLRQVLFPDYFFLKTKSEVELLALRNSWLKNYLHLSIVIPFKKKSIDFLFFRSMVRDDYKSLFHEIGSVINPEKITFVEEYKRKTDSLNLEASKFLYDHYWLYDYIKLGSELLNSCCFIRFIEYLYISQKILTFPFKFLIVFADMQPVENLLVQLTKITGRKTVTLQHGLYIDYGDMDTVNVVNYKHHCSDYFLAWGNTTKKLIEKYHNSTVVVCGKTAIYGLPNNHLLKKHGHQKNFLVVLDQKIFDDQNFLMLEIVCKYAQKKSLEIYVRFHPQNNKDMYLNKFPGLKVVTQIDVDCIVIGHTSSLIYEALTLGYESYRFSSHVPSLGFPIGLSFTDDDSFCSVLKRGFLSNSGREYIECIGDDSKAKYKLFFDALLEA